MKTLRVADSNNVSKYECNSERDAVKERAQLISAYGYNRANGFTRSSSYVDGDNTVMFHHAIHSTVVFTIR